MLGRGLMMLLIEGWEVRKTGSFFGAGCWTLVGTFELVGFFLYPFVWLVGFCSFGPGWVGLVGLVDTPFLLPT